MGLVVKKDEDASSLPLEIFDDVIIVGTDLKGKIVMKIGALYQVSVNGEIKSYTFSELRKDEESNDE